MPDAETDEKVSILIVDDDPSVGDALKLVLEANGYEVVLVNKGRDGIEESRERSFGFAIIDLFLPDISGLLIIKDIHERHPKLPLLLITARGSPEVFAEAYKLGATGALGKPFQPAEILTLITQALTK